MENQRSCPGCQGTMVLISAAGRLFWRCQRCGKKLPHSSDDLKEY